MKRSNKNNYVYTPTDMKVKNGALKVIYRRKYLGKVPKSLIYKLKKSLYLYIMEYMKTRPINKVAVLNRAEAVILDQKYAKRYTLIADMYDSFEEKYERLANDLGYNILSKLIFTGKLSLGLALSLFIILKDPTLEIDDEFDEIITDDSYYGYQKVDNIIELTEKPEDFVANTPLTDIVYDNTPHMEAMVYTQEKLNHHLLSPEKQREFEYFVNEYALYFNYNPDYLIDLFKNATEDYSNIDLILNGERFDLTNPETVAIMYIYYFYRGPQKYLGINLKDYGYESKDDFVITDEIFIIEPNWMHDHVEDKTIAKEDITLRNGLTYSEYVGRMCDLIGIPDEYKDYVLSVSFAERGQFGSENSIYKNNMGGILDEDGNVKTFTSPEAGIIIFVANLRGYEWKFNITDMVKFGNTYDGDENVDQWIKNVKDNKIMIVSNREAYFLTPEEEITYYADIQTLIMKDDEDYEVIPLKLNLAKSSSK